MVGDFNSLIDFLLGISLNVIVGITSLYLSGYFIGQKMQYLIVTREWNSVITGIIGLLLILIIGIFMGSSVAFLQEGVHYISTGGGVNDALFDYYIKPLFWILFFGIIPTIISGGIMGAKIKEHNQ